MNRTRKTVLIIWIVLLAGCGTYAHTHGMGPIDALRNLAHFMTTSPWAIPAFILLFAVRPATLFSSALMAVAGGAFFGAFWGSIATIVGANLGGTWSYWAAYAFSNKEEKLAEPFSWLKGYIEVLRQRGFQTVLFLHLIHTPYDMVSYGCGYVRIDFKQFFVGTIVGSFPGFLSLVVAGASSGISDGSLDLDPMLVVASAAVLCLTMGLAEVARRKMPDLGVSS
jgi:uncharacterized membrane protein YdjX (TVP38/TMEM64 family)